MKKREYIVGGISVSIAAILWGFDGIVLTPRLFNLDVFLVVFMLHLIPFLLMNLFLYREYRQLRKFSLQDTAVFVGVALFGGFIGTAAIVKALFLVNFQELSVVVLLQKLQPVFSIFLAAVFLREPLRKGFVVWAAIAIVASYFLVFGTNRPEIEAGSNTVQAALFALLASFSFGSSTVLSKKLLNRYAFQTGTFFRYGFTTLILFVIVLFTGKLEGIQEITSQNWLYFLIIALTTGSGAIFLYYYGLIRINAMLATMCELFFPISAIYFDYLVNDKILSPVQWVAAIVIVSSIIKLNQQSSKRVEKLK
jgi:drug/metabolite transporter (DMT)-like permease